MIASAALAEGKRDAQRRLDGEGLGLNIVQLAGCEPRWMAEGARIAASCRRRHHRHQHGLPGQARHRRQSGSALMRDLDHALTLIDATSARSRAGDAEDAARLGRQSRNAPELARRAEAAGIADHRARAHALPVLQGRADWARCAP
jgi:tRNA-dihydrouridine synthase